MFIHKPRKSQGLALLFGVIGLIAASAGPAGAGHYTIQGGGSGSGWELGPDVDNFCTSGGVVVATQFETTYYDLSFSSTSTYVVRDTGGAIVATYTGPVSTRVDHGDMVSYPTHAEPGECADADGTPGPVPLTDATVSGSNNGATVSCDMTSANGTYERVEDDRVTISFDAPCTVTSNGGSPVSTSIHHTITATQTPCFQTSCSNGDAGSKLDPVSYVLSHS